MKCSKCNQEFTSNDKTEANYTEMMGQYSHRMCPGTKCAICGEAIQDFAQAKHTPCHLGTGWQHKSCRYRVPRPASRNGEPEYDASSWIVKGK